MLYVVTASRKKHSYHSSNIMGDSVSRLSQEFRDCKERSEKGRKEDKKTIEKYVREAQKLRLELEDIKKELKRTKDFKSLHEARTGARRSKQGKDVVVL